MIFVYSNQKHGGPTINSFNIPGYLDPVEPVFISFALYYKNRDILKQAPYTPDRMKRIFGGDPPQIRFTYKDIRHLSFSNLVELCRYFGIVSPKHKSTEARREVIKQFLKERG